MINGVGSGAAASLPPEQEARIRGVAQQMEGVFVEQLFKAMRETVPEGGMLGGGSGEEMFTSMMDQHVAQIAPARWDRGIAAAVYRQLRNMSIQNGSPAAAPEGGEP